MTKHPDKHKHDSPKQGLHNDWRTWAVVVLMLAAMLIYIFSDNEAIQPGGGEGPQVPAAE
jgi:hypothetical protein